MNNNLIVKHNDFLALGYKLSLNEQRILLACISQVDSQSLLEQNQQFEISVQEIKDIFGNPNTTTSIYVDLREACDRLFERRIVIKSDSKTTKLRWVWKVEYLDNEATIRLNFSPDVIPYLSEITKCFTKYKLNDVKDFKCIYSLRLYELFAQYQGIGTREITVDELRRLFDLGDKYIGFASLKRSVVDKAIKEINQHSNLTVTCGLRKAGARVVAFQFEFETKQKPITDEKKSLTIDEYVRLNPAKTKGKSELEVRKLMKQQPLA
jgi:plasmid replication initiation protein